MKHFDFWSSPLRVAGTMLFLLLLSGTACYDDAELRKELTDLKSRIERIEAQAESNNKELETLRSLLETLQGNVYVAKVEQTSDGCKIHFTDGTTTEISNGTPGADAPTIGVREFDGVYYWVLTRPDGSFDYLTDQSGNKLRADAVTPVLGVDAQGYWTISYDGGKLSIRILDAAGEPVEALGGVLKGAESTDEGLVITLADGTTVTVPIRSDFYMLLTDAPKVAYFKLGQTLEFAVEQTGVERFTINKPDEWHVSLEGDRLTVTAPAAEHETCAELAGEVAVTYFSISGLGSILSLRVEVGAGPVVAEQIELNYTATNLSVGGSRTLVATVYPENAEDKLVMWNTSAEEIATVDASGKVRAVAPGVAIITATCGKATAMCEVTVRLRKAQVGYYYFSDNTWDQFPIATKTVIGIIYQLNEDGYSGKILSLDESSGIIWAEADAPETKSYDSNDGRINMAAVAQIAGWQSLYPSFAWCAAKTDGGLEWYLPALNELREIFAATCGLRWVESNPGEGEVSWTGDNVTMVDGEDTDPYPAARVAFNARLTKAGGMKLNHDHYYWSSTEKDSMFAYFLFFGGGHSNALPKFMGMADRSVRAIARFDHN